MQTVNRAKSLAGTGKEYTQFVLEVKAGQYAIVVNTDGGTLKALTKLNESFPSGLALKDGLYVMQCNRRGPITHVQFPTAEGNRSYGWAFDTQDPACRAIAP